MASRSMSHKAAPSRLAKIVRSIIAWWTIELRQLLPDQLTFGTERHFVHIAISGEALRVRVQGRSRRSASKPATSAVWAGTQEQIVIARRKAKGSAVILHINEAEVLHQQLALPHTSDTSVDDILRFGLESWSPFRADEVYAKAVRQATGTRGDEIEVRYALRRVVDPDIERARDAGLSPDHLCFGEAGFMLDLGTKKSTQLRRSRAIGSLFAALSFALCVACIGGLYVRGVWEEAELLQRIGLIESQLRARQADEDTRKAAAAQEQQLTFAIASKPLMLPMLNALANRMPDDIRIETIELSAEMVRARLSLRSSKDPSSRLSSGAMLSGFAIQSVLPQSVGFYQIDVSAPIGALQGQRVQP